jgi:bifunctional non-homologous end joining protein LigD
VAATKKPTSGALTAYRAKRHADRTPEPAGALAPSAAPGGGALRFVVHKHAARRLHYDLRLEMDGVLKSWAVPRGPSRNPADKRLAVHVEDHPLEYGEFEGMIPEGNYGAGAVILWDRGAWVPLEDPAAGLKTGKLLFELRGYKLRGKWTLVKIKRAENEWLLIKEKDAFVSTNGDQYPEGSVMSGLTVEQLRDGTDPAEPLRAELQRLKAPRRRVALEDAEPMLAETQDAPFDRKGWVFELKLDGYRMRAGRDDGTARILTRNGNDATPAFPEIAKAVAALPYDGLVLDGEIVVHDEAGRPSFQRLQNRARLSRAPEVKRAVVESPAAFYVFDVLAVAGFDVRPLPLERRKALLARLLPAAGPLRYSEHFAERGVALYERVVQLGLEGIVAKKADAPYRAGRSPSWVKVRADRTDDFVVVGYTAPQGSRGGFGALHVADYVDGRLTYAGRAGSGFTAAELKAVRAQLDALQRPDPPCAGPVPQGEEHHWVEPRLVCEVRYRERTDDGVLRHPVFLRFRDDKRPEECIRRQPPAARADEPELARPTTHHLPRTTHQVTFSNLDKVFWPEDRYTKGDLIEYYRAVAPRLQPYLQNRPVVLTRYPDGIAGKSFFQKDAPAFIPEWLRTVRIWSEDTQRDIDYFVCEDEAAILYLANLASIPLHIWASRVDDLEHPDWCILDLDPKGAPLTDVVEVARALRRLCDEIGLPSYIKTSGSSGLHVLVPLAGQCTYEQSRTLGQLLAKVVVADLPDIATITRQVTKRGGKVYLDYVQNGHGRLLVAPFSVRPLPGAPVSTPLEWREVTPKLDIRKFTIKTVPARLKKQKTDPLAGVLTDRPDLVSALERLQARL